MSAVSKALYMPLQIGTSVAGGLLAGKLFTEIWQRVSPSDQEPPDPKDLDPVRARGDHRRRPAGAGRSASFARRWTAPARTATRRSPIKALSDHGIMA